MIRIALFTAAALSLAACGNTAPAEPEPPVTGKNPAIVTRYEDGYSDIAKVCDEGRAVYYVRDDNSAAIAIVPDAKECR
jgi:hypothetical protein